MVLVSCEEKGVTVIGNYLRETPSIILTPEEYANVAYSGNNELSETEVTDITQQFIRRISRDTKSRPFWPSRIVPFGYNMIDPSGQNSIDHLTHLLL